MPKKSGSGISRRGFIKTTGTGALTAGLGPFFPAKGALNPRERMDLAKADSALVTGKIALEEHFGFPETLDASYAASNSEFRRQIEEIGGRRISDKIPPLPETISREWIYQEQA